MLPTCVKDYQRILSTAWTFFFSHSVMSFCFFKLYFHRLKCTFFAYECTEIIKTIELRRISNLSNYYYVRVRINKVVSSCKSREHYINFLKKNINILFIKYTITDNRLNALLYLALYENITVGNIYTSENKKT